MVDISKKLKEFCQEKKRTIDVDVIINIFIENNILIQYSGVLEFKHSYWIFYFAATYMLHDRSFRDYIFTDRVYVNYPEIIEFYTGVDGRRERAVKVLLEDLKYCLSSVEDKIGVVKDINPLDSARWYPTENYLEEVRKEISVLLKDSKLPSIIKDKYADKSYDSEAPYDQSINQFMNDYSVYTLMQSIKATSRALRNSGYVDTEIRLQMQKSIFDGWELISKVIFILSPTLAKQRRASFDGFGLILADSFEGSDDEILKKIYLLNPFNVVRLFKDDLSSKKDGPLVFNALNDTQSHMQKHLICTYMINEKPTGWRDILFNHMNRLHRNSFYLGNLYDNLNNELSIGLISNQDSRDIRHLVKIAVAKVKIAQGTVNNKDTPLPQKQVLSDANKLPIDTIMARGK